MARVNSRIVRWKLTLESLWIMNRTTGWDCYLWRNLLIITQNKPALGTRLLSSTAGTTYVFLTKKTSTLAPGPKQLMSWPKNLWILWLHTERTYNMLENCKNEPIRKELSLKVTLLARRFVWIANISKPNAIRSWRQSFLGLFEFCTQ